MEEEEECTCIRLACQHFYLQFWAVFDDLIFLGCCLSQLRLRFISRGVKNQIGEIAEMEEERSGGGKDA